MRGLGAHLIPPHLGAAPWGRGELDLAPLGLGPGYCIVLVRARSGVFDTSPPPPSLPCAGVLTSPHLWGYAQGRTASPFHPSRESPTVSDRNGVLCWTGLPARLEVAAEWGARAAVCVRPHPAGVGRKVPGKSQVLETGGFLRGQVERPRRFSVRCTLFCV